MPQRKVSGEATHQEAPGATIVRPDDSTSARQHAGFSLIDRAAPMSATRTEQLPTLWTEQSKREPSATSATACYPAFHNVDSSFSHHRPAEYAHGKRRTLNQNSQKPEEGLPRIETATGSPVLNRPPNRDSFKDTIGWPERRGAPGALIERELVSERSAVRERTTDARPFTRAIRTARMARRLSRSPNACNARLIARYG